MKNLWYISLLALLLTSCEKNISEFQTQNFIKFFGSVDGGEGFDVFELSEGGYLITGSINIPQFRNQVLVARVNKAGNIVWQKQFGTEHNETGVSVKTLNNEVLIVGNKVHYLTGVSEGFLLRVNLQGDSLGFYTYSAPNNLIFNSMALSNNLIYIAGESYLSTPSVSRAYVVCVNSDGSLVWPNPRFFGDNEFSQSFKKIFIKSNGRLLAVGTSKNLVGTNNTNISVVEMNNSGSPTGGVNIIASSDRSFGNAFLSGNSLYILSNSSQSTVTTSRLASISDSNSFEWEFDLPFSGQGVAMAQIENNSILFASEDNSGVTFHTIEVLDGSLQESYDMKSFPGIVKSIINTSDNGVITIGTTSPDYGTMVRLIKTDEELYLLKP